MGGVFLFSCRHLLELCDFGAAVQRDPLPKPKCFYCTAKTGGLKNRRLSTVVISASAGFSLSSNDFTSGSFEEVSRITTCGTRPSIIMQQPADKGMRLSFFSVCDSLWHCRIEIQEIQQNIIYIYINYIYYILYNIYYILYISLWHT